MSGLPIQVRSPELSGWIGSRLLGRLVPVLLLGVISIGCGQTDELVLKYGACSGQAGDAVAGTSLFADQFVRSGYRVATARTLGRVIERAQVVVWFPDRFAPPDDQTCQFFNRWLSDSRGRALIYVGRDFDARSAYWQRLLSESRPGNALAIRQRLAQSRATWATQRASLPATASCPWFAIDRDQGPVEARPIEGPLAGSLASSSHQLVIHDRLKVTNADAQVEVLLSVGGQPMIRQYQLPFWPQSRLLIVTNASPLLNLGLTLPAHRQLAQELIDLCGTPDRCVFLTSDARDPLLAEEAEVHHLIRIFTTAPFSSVLMHLSVMGLIYCFAVYPMFGRARSIDSLDKSDFGRHVEALGRLLAKTKDSPYAQAQRNEYLHRVAGQIPEPGREPGENPFGESAVPAEADEAAKA